MMSRLAVALVILLGLAATPARASLTLCDRTSYVLYAATGAAVPGGVQAQGWTRVTPGSCRIVIAGDLTAPPYYLYARSSRAHAGPARAWGGNASICAKDANFSNRDAVNANSCASDDYFQLPFAAVDTHRMRSWTATFSETPRLRRCWPLAARRWLPTRPAGTLRPPTSRPTSNTGWRTSRSARGGNLSAPDCGGGCGDTRG